jgi:hypothetical protein
VLDVAQGPSDEAGHQHHHPVEAERPHGPTDVPDDRGAADDHQDRRQDQASSRCEGVGREGSKPDLSRHDEGRRQGEHSDDHLVAQHALLDSQQTDRESGGRVLGDHGGERQNDAQPRGHNGKCGDERVTRPVDRNRPRGRIRRGLEITNDQRQREPRHRTQRRQQPPILTQDASPRRPPSGREPAY